MKMRPNVVYSAEFSLEAICNDILGHVMAWQSNVFFQVMEKENSRLFARSGHVAQIIYAGI